MKTWLAIAIGGALGSVGRHAVNRAVQHFAIGGWPPSGVFIINVAGSGAIGLLAGLLASGRVDMSSTWRVFIVVGLLGGFTTFSAFTLDSLTLMQGGHYGQAFSNAVGQVVLGLAAAWVGFALAQSGVKIPIG